MKRKKWIYCLSGLLLSAMLINQLSLPALAETMEETENMEEQERPPQLEKIRELLYENEIVKAADLEIEYGSSFDTIMDLSYMLIPDPEAVRVTFLEACNKDGEEFTTYVPDTYEAVYYVEPLQSDHPIYQISRNLIVMKEGMTVERKPLSEVFPEDFPSEETTEDVPEVLEEPSYSEPDTEDTSTSEEIIFSEEIPDTEIIDAEEPSLPAEEENQAESEEPPFEITVEDVLTPEESPEQTELPEGNEENPEDTEDAPDEEELPGTEELPNTEDVSDPDDMQHETPDIEEVPVEDGTGQDEMEADVIHEITVELKHLDVTTGKQLPGAHLRLTDSNGTILDEWISGVEAHVMKDLSAGNTYEVSVTRPASGYATAESIRITVLDTEDVQSFTMESDVTKVYVKKTDMLCENEIPGAKLTILDPNERVIEKWVSNNTAHYIERLPIGAYILREETAPSGFVISKDVDIEVKDTPEVQKISLENETAKGKLLLNLTDAENEEPIHGAEFEFADSTGKVLEILKTDSAGHAETHLYEIGQKYYLTESKAADGYLLDSTRYEISFAYRNQDSPVIEVIKNLTNREMQKQLQNQLQKETTEATQLHENPKTGDDTNLLLAVVVMLTAGFAIIAILDALKKTK